MAWPVTSINTSYFDSVDDSPEDALPHLLMAMETINTIVASRGAVNGVCPLNGAMQVPSLNLPVGSQAGQVAAGDHTHSTYQAVSAILTAIATLTTGSGFLHVNNGVVSFSSGTSEVGWGAITGLPSPISAIAPLVVSADKFLYFTGATSAALSPITSIGLDVLQSADYNALRTSLGLGTASTMNIGDFAPAGAVVEWTNVGNRPLPLVAVGALTASANVFPYYTGVSTAAMASLTSFSRGLLALADASAWRGVGGLGLGSAAMSASTDFAATGHTHTYASFSGVPDAINALQPLTPAANKFAYYTATTTAAMSTVTATALLLLAEPDAAAMRTRLGLGSAATSASSAFATATHFHNWSDVSAVPAALTSIAALTPAANQMVEYTGASTATLRPVGSVGRSVLAAATVNDAVTAMSLNTLYAPLDFKRLTSLVVDYATDVSVGNAQGYFYINESFNGKAISAVHAKVVTTGATGLVTVDLVNVRTGLSIFSTVLTIDSAEAGSDTAATPAVVNNTNAQLQSYDLIRVDVTTTQTTKPKGLFVTLKISA